MTGHDITFVPGHDLDVAIIIMCSCGVTLDAPNGVTALELARAHVTAERNADLDMA